jgi:His-Xaa-Ser system radical SAM maturase HxsC
VPSAWGLRQLSYLDDGDVVAVDPNGFARTLYRRASGHNFILVTEQCNSLCLMCSQPPKAIDDSDRFEEHLRLVDLIDPSTRELGITGGEPTLFRDRFLELIARCKERLPATALHILSNGRLFWYRRFAEKLGAIAHPDLVVGIPLYSDVDSRHDHIVQASGAFEETVIGLQNLDRYGVRVEIRVVLHALSIPRLPQLATFIARNFPFASQVALMGLEMFGLVHQHLAELWIDPADYQLELAAASGILCDAGMNVAIYNHQLCVLDRRLWPLARRSISDWKNVYLPECRECSAITDCGGFFQSGTKVRSAKIRAMAGPEMHGG